MHYLLLIFTLREHGLRYMYAPHLLTTKSFAPVCYHKSLPPYYFSKETRLQYCSETKLNTSAAPHQDALK